MNISQLLTKLKTLVYSKNEVDTKLSAVVHTSGAEDISGNKNFIDNLTCSGKNVDVIEEQGDRYIRYSNGLQICWGVSNLIQCDQRATVNFTVSFNAFSSNPSLSLTRFGGVTGWAQLQCSITYLTTTYAQIHVFNNSSENVSSRIQYLWYAIGRWK